MNILKDTSLLVLSDNYSFTFYATLNNLRFIKLKTHINYIESFTAHKLIYLYKTTL